MQRVTGCGQGPKENEAKDDKVRGLNVGNKASVFAYAPTSYQRQPTQGSDFTSLALESLK